MKIFTLENKASSFKNILSKMLNFIKSNHRIQKFIAIIIILLMLLSSGYAPLALALDSSISTIIDIIILAINFIIFLSLLNFGDLINKVKSKKIPASYIILLVIGLSTILTMLASGDVNNLMAYLGYGMTIVNGFIIAKLFNYKMFFRIFNKIIFCLTFVGLSFYFFFLISGVNISPLPTFVSSSGHEYANFFYLSFQNVNSTRFQGFAWEPGLMSSFLIESIIFEIIFEKKVNKLHFIVMTLGIIFTFSTFAYILYPFVLLLLLNKILKNKKVFYSILIVSLVAIFLCIIFSNQILTFLASAMPQVFGKFLDENSTISLTTRLFSPYVDLLIFMKSPIWGVGITDANNLYLDYINSSQFSSLIDSQTSSTFLMMAQFGIFGIIPTLMLIVSIFKIKNDSFKPAIKIILSIILFLIWNKEPHTRLLFDWVMLFIFIKMGFEKAEPDLLFETPSNQCLLKTITKSDSQAVLKRNIIGSFVIKGIALCISFFSLPIYISYFSGDAVLGVWLTILSVLQWVMTFDLGLGNGLKNKLIEAMSRGDKKRAKELVSSTYISSIIIASVIMVCGVIIFSTIDLNALLNIKSDVISPLFLKLAVIIAFLSICIEFFLKNVTAIYQALQRQVVSSSFSLISSLLLIVFVLIFRFDNPNFQLLYIAIAYFFIINIPFIIGTIVIFYKKLAYARPSFKYFSLNGTKAVMTLGLSFFVIQLALLFINSTNNLLISNIFGSDVSVIFNKYYRPFHIVYSLFALISAPYWSMTAKAKAENNYGYIRKMFKQMLLFSVLFIILIAFMTIILQPFLNLWLGEETIQVEWYISLIFAINTFELIFLSTFTSIANGISQIKPQMVSILIAGVLKVPLVYLLNFLLGNMSNWPLVILIDNVVLAIPIIVVPIFLIKEIFVKKREMVSQ